MINVICKFIIVYALIIFFYFHYRLVQCCVWQINQQQNSKSTILKTFKHMAVTGICVPILTTITDMFTALIDNSQPQLKWPYL